MTVPAAAAPSGALARFHVHQRVSPLQHTYRVLADLDGEPGPLIAFAARKRLGCWR